MSDEIQIAYNNPKKRYQVIEKVGFTSVEDACDALIDSAPTIWGIVQRGRPYEWQTLYKYSRKYGLRSVEEIEQSKKAGKRKAKS
jgi:uncharacterized protein YycO